MKILILTHSYPDSVQKWRGIFIREQAEALSSIHEVTVVYFRVDYSVFAPFSGYSFVKKERGRLTEFEVTTTRSLPVITQLKYLKDTCRFVEKEILKTSKPDIIHSHLSYPAGILGVIIGRRKKIPSVLTEHTWIKKYFRSLIHKRCVLHALKNSDIVIAVSEALKEDILSYGGKNAEVVPNVIDTDKFPLSGKGGGKTLNLGILGGMSNYRKGLDILLQAVALVQNPDVIVHIGGDGTLLTTFRKLAAELGIEKKCIFYGEILQTDLVKFYSKLDLFVLASRDETFGVVVVEAMASGLPVIATRCGGPEEIITKETGLLVEKENPAELAKAIDYISETIGTYDHNSIRKYAVEKYGQKAFVEKMTRHYGEIFFSCQI